MSALSDLDWREVRDHYDEREGVHKQLLKFFENDEVDDFVDLLLGIDDRAGNYSAHEHNLGPRIISNNRNADRQIMNLAKRFIDTKNASVVPQLIRSAAISYLKIGVGSEASCMLNPHICWVANTRSIWAHLVIKHADNFGKANEELQLYRDHDDSSEMAYRIWAAIHRELSTSMARIAEEGGRLAKTSSIEAGKIKYIWADAIANALYSRHHK